MITCKICEKEVQADRLGPHSLKCKDLIESKDHLSSIIFKMKIHGQEAINMKHMLEANAAKQKKKQVKRRSCMNLVDLGLANPRMSSMSSESDISQPLSQMGSETEIPSLEEDRNGGGISTRDTLDNLEDALIMRMTEKDYRKFIKEANKSLIVLKKVIMYSKDIINRRLETNSACDVETNTQNELEEDLKGIVDKNMQKFLRKFLTDLEAYIETRQRYLKAFHELTRVNSCKNLRDLKPKSFSGRPAFTQLGQASCPTKNFQKARPVLKKESPPAKPLTSRRVPLTALPISNAVRKDSRKPMLQINPNQMQGTGNYVPVMATARRAPEDGMSMKDKIKMKLNLNFNLNFGALEKATLSVRSGQPSPNLFAVPQKKENKVVVPKLVLKSSLPMCAISRNSRAEQKKEGEKPQRKRTMSQDWFKTLRNEDSKGLSPFLSRDNSGKALTSRAPITEPILNLVPRPITKGKKLEDDSGFIDSLRECYSDYGPYRVNRQVTGQDSDRQHVTFDDFEIIKFIGKGAYGEVWLVKKKATGDLYAMKTVDWSNKAVQSKLKDIKAEKDIYQALEGDLVVKAFWTFHHENLICFVTEYMLGGDFDRLLDRLGRLEEDQARFYFAELVLAVESLHSLKVVHRDLKPDNIMMDAKGHIRLTDFGLSKNALNKYKSGSTPMIKDTLSPKVSPKVDDPLFKAKLTLYKFCKTQSRMPPKVNVNFKQCSRKSKVVFGFLGKPECHKIVGKKHALKKLIKDSPVQNNCSKPKMVGTPDYMAPEIISPEDYNLEGYDEKCMDWWSMGVILYQFLVGMPAFCDTSIEGVFDNIKNRRIEWPPIGDEEDCISPEAADLIQQLLNPDPKKRLGVHGAAEVKDHPFFREIDWAELREKQAPIIPCSTDDEQSNGTPIQTTTKVFPNTANPPGHTRHSSLRIVKPIDFGAFRMRRLDLLDQANQQTHKDMQRKTSCLVKL